MTEKENFYALVRFQSPEWIPRSAPAYSVCYKGCNHENAEGQGHHSPIGTTWRDIWGTTWHRDLEGVMGFPKAFPLEDLESLDSFAFPDPDDPACFGQIYEQKKGYTNDKILCGSHRDTLWERAYMLVGMENLMVYLHTESALVKRFLARLTDFQLKIARHYAAVGCEMVTFSDDHGMQNALLLGRKAIEEFFVPEYRRLLDFYRDKNVITHFHSCGHIEPILDIFIELGIDILNPIQAAANNLEAIRKVTAGKITLDGAVDSHVVLTGTKEDIRALVKKRIDTLGQEGGYICAPDQYMDFSEESLLVFADAVHEYGQLI